jgi:hypothetical protein
MEPMLSNDFFYLQVLLDLPIKLLIFIFSNPLWLFEIAFLIGVIFWFRWKKRQKPMFSSLAKKFPSLKKTDIICNAEKEAFEKLSPFILENEATIIKSKSLRACIISIKNDLRVIQKGLSSRLFKNNDELSKIWRYALYNIATNLAASNDFEDIAKKINLLKDQIKALEKNP